MILGTFLIAGGAVLIAVFGIVPEPTHSLEDLLVLFNRPAFIVYFSLLGVSVGVALVTVSGLELGTLWTNLTRNNSIRPIYSNGPIHDASRLLIHHR
jgi:hypothetical protein